MKERLYLIKIREGIILREGAVAVTKESAQYLYMALQDAKPVVELKSWAEIANAGKVYTVNDTPTR